MSWCVETVIVSKAVGRAERDVHGLPILVEPMDEEANADILIRSTHDGLLKDFVESES